jgi:hypothetical protein
VSYGRYICCCFQFLPSCARWLHYIKTTFAMAMPTCRTVLSTWCNLMAKIYQVSLEARLPQPSFYVTTQPHIPLQEWPLEDQCLDEFPMLGLICSTLSLPKMWKSNSKYKSSITIDTVWTDVRLVKQWLLFYSALLCPIGLLASSVLKHLRILSGGVGKGAYLHKWQIIILHKIV